VTPTRVELAAGCHSSGAGEFDVGGSDPFASDQIPTRVVIPLLRRPCVVTANYQSCRSIGTSESFDRFNNVEQVVWEQIPSGDVKIVIRAFRITNLSQPYAYAWRLT
jgi:hypothetical protein